MAKAQPGKLAYASNGNGSSGRMATEMLRQATGIDMVHVPYKGGGPSMTDLIGGQVPMLLHEPGSRLPQVQAGKARAIGVASLKRNRAYPTCRRSPSRGFPVSPPCRGSACPRRRRRRRKSFAGCTRKR